MSISLKRAPYISDPEVKRAFDKLYDDLNDLINAVNPSIIALKDSASGKPGDIRIQKVSENKYRIEGMTEEGWIRPGGVDNNITKLTDGSTGTASNTLVEITGTYVQATMENTTASLAAKINEIITELDNITFRLVKNKE